MRHSARPVAEPTDARRDQDGRRTPLIGIDELEPPSWATAEERKATAGGKRSVRPIMTAAGVVVALSWQASRRLTMLSAITQVVSGAITTVALLATADLLGRLLAQGPTPDRVINSLPAIALLVAALSIRALFDGAATLAQGALAPQIVEAAQHNINKALVEVELAAYDDPSFRELTRQGIRYAMPCIEQTVRILAQAMASLVMMVGALVSMAVLNAWLVPVLLLGVAAETWSATRMARLDFANFLSNAARQLRLGVVQGLITERTTAAEVRAYGLQDALLDEHRRVARRLTREAIQLETRKSAVRLIGRALAGVGAGLAFVLLGILLYVGAMPLALAGAAVVAMRSASAALATTMRSVNQVYDQAPYIAFFQKLLQEAADRRRRASAVPAPANPATIVLDHVWFTYPEQTIPALRDISLTIRRGEVVALVGENGSGKTTLGRIVAGLYRATEGAVYWDGVDIATVDERSLHDGLALICQEPVKWPMTAEHNVRIGRLDHGDPDDARWRRAITASGADEVVDSLPEHERTILSKQFVGGRDLSGGQWQRLAVARGIYRDGSVLIADEPTAALDARAEGRVFAGLREATCVDPGDGGDGSRFRTTILVTHRLVNVHNVDRIIVLHEGRIVEQGTHHELVSAGGRYAEMFALQARPYTAIA